MFKKDRKGLCAVKGCNIRPRSTMCCSKHGEHEDAAYAYGEAVCHEYHKGEAIFKWCKYCYMIPTLWES